MYAAYMYRISGKRLSEICDAANGSDAALHSMVL
jgi:hypothetical protein